MTRVGISSPSKDYTKTGRFELAGNDALVLHCFYAVGGQWQHKQFSPRTKNIRIGPSSSDNEIGLDDHNMDKQQALIQRIDSTWYVMECGKEDLMRVNGIPARQIVLKGKSSCVIQIKNSFVVLLLVDKHDERTKMQKRKPLEGEFWFSLSSEDCYPFDAGKLCLIGANDMCDFHTGLKDFLASFFGLEGEAKLFEQGFLGMVFNYKGRLFMQSFTESITVNNEFITSPVLLQKNNVVAFNSAILSLELPNSVLTAVPPEFSKLEAATFCLLPLDDPAQNFPELHIPSNARSLTIGRSSSQSDIGINEKNISRQHAQFIVYPKSMMIYDCGSSNGTFVNDEKITKKTVKPGDMIRFGDVSYFFCYAD